MTARRFVFLLFVLVSLGFSAPASAEVLRNMDFNTCNESQWSGAQDLPGRITYPNSGSEAANRPVPRQGAGTCMARIEVRRGDDPINSSGERAEFTLFGNLSGAVIGNDRWYGWSTYIPLTTPATTAGWSIIAQWHGPGGGPSAGQPNFSISLNGTVRVYGGCTLPRPSGGGPCPQGTHNIGQHPRGRWVDWAVHIQWSDRSTGRITVFRDDDQVWDDAGPNLYTARGAYLKSGIYRGPTSATWVAYFDNWKIGTTRADVDLDVVGPPPPGPVTVSQTIADGSRLSGTVNWRATVTGCVPSRVDFLLNEASVLNERTKPFGDTAGFWNSTTAADGSHRFAARATCPNGVFTSPTATATVDNVPDPPPLPTVEQQIEALRAQVTVVQAQLDQLLAQLAVLEE